MSEDIGRPEGPEPLEDAEEDPFQSALAALAGTTEARVDVYRTNRRSGAQEYMGRLGVEEFDLERVRDRWGGGKFQFRAVKGSKYVKAVTVSVAGPYKDMLDEESPEERDERRGAEVDAKRKELEGAGMADAVASLRADLREFLREVRNPPPAAQQADPARMTTELLTTVQTMMQPYLEMMRERMADRGDRRDVDPMEYLRLGLDIAESRGGGDSGYESVVRSLGLPLLAQLQAQGAAERGAPAAFTPNPPAGAGEEAAMQPTDALAALAPWVPTLLGWANADSDPEIRADFVVDELPDKWLAMLGRFCAQPDALTAFLNRYPRTMEHRVWFERFFAGLRLNFGLGEDGRPTGDDDGDGRPEVGTGAPPE